MFLSPTADEILSLISIRILILYQFYLLSKFFFFVLISHLSRLLNFSFYNLIEQFENKKKNKEAKVSLINTTTEVHCLCLVIICTQNFDNVWVSY